MFLLVEKGIRAGICHAIYRYVKASKKYIKSYCKNIICSILGFKKFEWISSASKITCKWF